MQLMLDGNQRLTEPQALQIAAAIERLGFAWFEDPIPLIVSALATGSPAPSVAHRSQSRYVVH
jgi:Enolase C-terminal domain-like